MKRKGLSIKVKIIIIFFLFAFLSLVGIDLANYIFTSDVLRKMANSNLEQIAEMTLVQCEMYWDRSDSQYHSAQEEEFLFNKLKESILSRKIGESGFSFVLNTEGTYIIHPLVEGENWKGKHAFIDKILEEKNGILSYTSPVKKKEKIIAFRYLEDKQWIIASGVFWDDYNKPFIRLISIIGIAGIVFFIPFMFVLILLTRAITDPILKITTLTTKMGNGDLSIVIPGRYLKRSDEIGLLAENISKAIQSLKNIISGAKDTSVQSLETGESLSREMEQTASSVEEISANVGSIKKQFSILTENISDSSTAVNEILSNISNLVDQIGYQAGSVTETSAAIEEMTASINSVAKIAVEKKTAVNSLLNTTQAGGEKVNITNSIIKEITASIDGMMEMIDVINSITSQTSLLSMNAAIEAAHAGDYGKGFAVVADEIRKLADSTAESSKRISASLEDVIEKINRAEKYSIESGDSFSGINSEVKEVVDAFSEISSSTDELAAGSNEVLKASTTLLNITEEIKNGSEEMKIGAEQINNGLVNVKDISSESLQGISEISIGLNEINSAITKISELSKQNKQVTERLNDEISNFKTDSEV